MGGGRSEPTPQIVANAWNPPRSKHLELPRSKHLEPTPQQALGTHPAASCDPPETGGRAGRDLLSLQYLTEPSRKAFRTINKHSVPFPSTLPFREGRSLLRGGFHALAAGGSSKRLLRGEFQVLAAGGVLPRTVPLFSALSTASHPAERNKSMPTRRQGRFC